MFMGKIWCLAVNDLYLRGNDGVGLVILMVLAGNVSVLKKKK